MQHTACLRLLVPRANLSRYNYQIAIIAFYPVVLQPIHDLLTANLALAHVLEAV